MNTIKLIDIMEWNRIRNGYPPKEIKHVDANLLQQARQHGDNRDLRAAQRRREKVDA